MTIRERKGKRVVAVILDGRRPDGTRFRKRVGSYRHGETRRKIAILTVADRMRRDREREFPEFRQEIVPSGDQSSIRTLLDSIRKPGVFYVVQLVPDLLPNRIKCGFSEQIEKRMKQHFATCPSAKIVKEWNCYKHEEKRLMREAQVLREPYWNRVGQEVFDVHDVADAVDRVDKIMGRILAQAQKLSTNPESLSDPLFR